MANKFTFIVSPFSEIDFAELHILINIHIKSSVYLNLDKIPPWGILDIKYIYTQLYEKNYIKTAP